MSFTPPPHPNTRPRQDRVSPNDREARAFAQSWLAHVEAGRIGGHLQPAGSTSGDASQPPLEAGKPKLSEETRAAILANERVLRGEGPLRSE